MRPVTKLALISSARRVTAHLPGNWDRRLREVGKIALNYRGDRKTAVRHLSYQLARRMGPVIVAPFGDVHLLVDARDQEVGRAVFLTGGYERWHMKAAMDHLARRGWSPEGRTFIDAGANIGTSTVDALVHFGFERAVCFEPVPDNLRLLRLNVLLNDLHDRVEVHAVALSDEDGAALIERSAGNFGDQRVRAVAAQPTRSVAGTHEVWVDCRRLDRYVAEGAIEPATVGLLWIDVQGHEPRILRGARSLVEAGVPVVLEYSPSLLHEGVTELEEDIRQHYTSMVDLRLAAAGGDGQAVLEPKDLPVLRKHYAAAGHTDLLLLP